jgi:toxin ParE1/3/4
LKRPVLWSEDALRELDNSIAYIAARNPSAARKVLAEIRKAANGLAATATGRPGRVSGTYEKTIIRRPYIIAYTLDRMAESALLYSTSFIRHEIGLEGNGRGKTPDGMAAAVCIFAKRLMF